MRRRRYLAAIGALTTTSLAGCSGGGGGTTDSPTDTQVSTASDTPQPATSQTGGTQTATTRSDASTDVATETESETDTATTDETTETPTGGASLRVGERAELTVNTEGDIASAVGGALVTNVGSAATGRLTASATFLDADGNELTTETSEIATLPAGKQWYSFVLVIGEAAEAAESYELAHDYEETPPNFTTEGITEVSSSSERQDDTLTITGGVRNETERLLSNVQATAFLYLDEGQREIVGTLEDGTDELGAGETWAYELSTQGVSEIAGTEVRYSYSSA